MFNTTPFNYLMFNAAGKKHEVYSNINTQSTVNSDFHKILSSESLLTVSSLFSAEKILIRRYTKADIRGRLRITSSVLRRRENTVFFSVATQFYSNVNLIIKFDSNIKGQTIIEIIPNKKISNSSLINGTTDINAILYSGVFAQSQMIAKAETRWKSIVILGAETKVNSESRLQSIYSYIYYPSFEIEANAKLKANTTKRLFFRSNILIESKLESITLKKLLVSTLLNAQAQLESELLKRLNLHSDLIAISSLHSDILKKLFLDTNVKTLSNLEINIDKIISLKGYIYTQSEINTTFSRIISFDSNLKGEAKFYPDLSIIMINSSKIIGIGYLLSEKPFIARWLYKYTETTEWNADEPINTEWNELDIPSHEWKRVIK